MALNGIHKLTFIIIAISILFSACNPGKQNQSQDTQTANYKQVSPNFNSDSAYTYVEHQVKFGPRVPNTPAQLKCAEYLIAQLKKYTPNVVVQETKLQAFNGKMLLNKNIIASFNQDVSNRIFISSHWDSRPFADQSKNEADKKKPIDGASDGASGVGIIIEIARQLAKQNPSIGVDLVLFDTEDYGQPEGTGLPPHEDSWCLGAQYWSKFPHRANYTAKFGILLDMVGAANAHFAMEGTSMQYAAPFVQEVWETASKIGYSDYFTFEKVGGITDDHYYINKLSGIPTLDIVQYSGSGSFFAPYWHTLDDNMSIIDKNTLKAVGQTLLEVIFTQKQLN